MKTVRRSLLALILAGGVAACGTSIVGPNEADDEIHNPDSGHHNPDSGHHNPDSGHHNPDSGH